MTQRTYLHYLVVATFATVLGIEFAAVTRADIFQWEYINPADPSQGKQQSTTLAPDGAGVNAVPGAYLSGRNLTMAYLIGADLTGATGYIVNLTNADLSQANLTDVRFGQATLTGSNLSQTHLTDAYFAGARLAGADLSQTSLTNANFFSATLTDADFSGADVRRASFDHTTSYGFTATQLYSTASYKAHDLTGINLASNNLDGWNFAGQNLTNAALVNANITNAEFTGAEVRGASFSAGGGELTMAQLYSTASYQTKNLTEISLRGDLNGWNFISQNLNSASFAGATITDADFTGANIRGANFARSADCCVTGSGITPEQLSSTASYKAGDLSAIDFESNSLAGANFTGQKLTGGNFENATLTDANFRNANLVNVNFQIARLRGADFTGADVRGANLRDTTSNGFTAAQLYLTASYQARDLAGIRVGGNGLSGWNFAAQNLTNANFDATTVTGGHFRQANLANADFGNATLTDADFRQANLTGANFAAATLTDADFIDAEVRGANFGAFSFFPAITISSAQLYLTASYKNHDLTGVDFPGLDVSGWSFLGQNLMEADFYGADLTGADFTDATLRWARFGQNCGHWSCKGTDITLAQLYSTASYKVHDLSGIGLYQHDLAGGNFAGQNLTDAQFGGSWLTDADFTAADARHASLEPPASATTTNLIWPDGHIDGVELHIGTLLVVRDYDGRPEYGTSFPPIPITVEEHLAMAPGGTLRMVFESDAWDSTISFAPGIPVGLGGTLELTFADDVNLASQIGRTFDLFDWTGVTPTGAFQVKVTPETLWDTSRLYTVGEVSMLPISSDIIVPRGGSYVAGGLSARSLTLAGEGSRLTIASIGGPGGPATVKSLSIASGATLDVTDNDLIVRATAETKSALHSEIQARIESAQNGFDANGLTNWNGPGLTSSTARTTNVAAGFDLTALGVIRNSDLEITTGVQGANYSTFGGQAVSPDDVLVKYTYIGDANLDGVINFDDYVGMDNAFFGLIPNLGWATGDINFDGVINFDDYCVVDQAFFFQAAPLTASANGPAAIPEPGTLLLVAVSSLMLLAYAARRQKTILKRTREILRF